MKGDPVRQAERECRRLARSHYENFLVASVLLPHRLRQPFYNIYAFCRTADDLADESATPEAALRALSEFQASLDATFQGHPADGIFLALAKTIPPFRLDQTPFDDLLDAFRQDQHQTRYETVDELNNYCRRSANPVGRIVLRMAEADDNETDLALSDQICTGLQLANFWQDVARDYAIGRIYIPQSELRSFGISESQFDSMASNRSTDKALKRLIQHQCNQTEAFFHRGMPLCDRVPHWLGRSLRLFAGGGLATLDAIRAIDFDVMRKRPKVSKTTQARLVLRSLIARR
ncbi:All-trans-phytoene synthase [Novipirellula galeiformis]|uniref:All-trans-phytoene synthase n=1 Tax=Novipirellula galeiformis TaxID=2528004 RepID=A0A5C6CS18_9BACT|nr:squalene synthase HpnC [Novipirellula galeiformis]TWU26354.1 All-trans-phytoene synthase [Novipirellula galeiformis]